MKTSLSERSEVSLPDGFTIRGAVMDDVADALELFNRWSRSVIHEDEITDAVAIRTEWLSPGLDPAEDIRLVFAPGGEMAGYIEVWTNATPPVHPWLWGRVDPRYEGLGIGSYLLTWAEARAKTALDRIPSDLRFAPQVGSYRQADKARALFEKMGYRHIRSSYTMRINLDAPPPAPEWSPGIALRLYNPKTDLEAVYRAVDESFSDHYGYVKAPFEEGLKRFEHFMTGYEGFDPTLWFLAMDGEEIAGISLCRDRAFDNPEVGWVSTLGVRRPWRKRGIGLALLRHSFGELYRRGKRMAGLGVDAENLTGALRLYERAGMRLHRAFDRFEKEVRPGREISVQSL
ncbi:MAG: GNAT family N-acetyltransferase [Anaerolineales bacterium]|nr:GNAT family N-acetyltransferase [Anaerolineales bacterium]NUQ86085.1 GNAT family N-acetyltransferase [Anaerolineales bacterium]